MELTTRLGLYSQTTRLCEWTVRVDGPASDRVRGSHPLRRLLPEDFCRSGPPVSVIRETTIRERRPLRISSLSSSRFTRSYWGNPG